MPSAPIILVPGFWLGAWAWDEVADLLRADGHDVTALTLPGLEVGRRRPLRGHASDHVDAIVDAVEAADGPSCSRSTAPRASPATPRATASRTGSPRWSTSTPRPGIGAAGPGFHGRREAARLGGASPRRRTSTGSARRSRRRSASARSPCPGGVLRERVELTNDARRDIPSTMICTGFTVGAVPEVRRRGARHVMARRRPRAAQRRPGSTCRPATGRCGRSRASWRTTSRRSRARRRTPSPPDAPAGSAGGPELGLRSERLAQPDIGGVRALDVAPDRPLQVEAVRDPGEDARRQVVVAVDRDRRPVVERPNVVVYQTVIPEPVAS